MIQKKSELFQIRLEAELLSQFKAMSDERGVHASSMLRYLMSQACDQYAEQKQKKTEFQQRKAEKQR